MSTIRLGDDIHKSACCGHPIEIHPTGYPRCSYCLREIFWNAATTGKPATPGYELAQRVAIKPDTLAFSRTRIVGGPDGR